MSRSAATVISGFFVVVTQGTAQLAVTVTTDDTERRKALAGEWKKEQDAMQKAGYVLSYKAIRTEAHNPTDCNIILRTEYTDLTTMEANADKVEQLGQQLLGGTSGIEAGYTVVLSGRHRHPDRTRE